MTRRKNKYGFTLVEMLVVLGIIALITAVSVPVLSRMGLFGTKEADLAARELFAVLRGIQVHASTNNVDTAIIYTVRTPIDTLATGEYFIDISTNPNNPVLADYRPAIGTGIILDSYMTVRKITPEELLLVDGGSTVNTDNDVTLRELLVILRDTDLPDGTDPNINPLNLRDFFSPDDVYVPIETRDGVFKPFPKDTAVLVNHPATLLNTVTLASDANSFRRETGLVPIFVVQIDINGETDAERTIEVSFIQPRILYQDRDLDGVGPGSDPQNLPGDLDSVWDYRFPAHVFHPDGTMQSPPASVSPKERIKLRMGLRPDQPVEDRFLFNSDTERIFTEFDLDSSAFVDDEGRALEFDAFGNRVDQGKADELVGIETEIHLFLSSGRVKVAS